MRSLVITGVSSGIGYATAKLAVEKGVRVFGSVRQRADGARLKREFGEGYSPLYFDVRDEAAVRAEAERVRGLLDGQTLFGLVNNVGKAIPGPLLEQPLAEIRDQLDTNLVSAFLVTQAFGPLLGADPALAGPPGRVVVMSSIGGKLGQPFAAAYIASKHGLEGFSDAVRRELRLYGIDVVLVAPGPVKTAVWDKVEPMIGRYRDTPYGEAYDTGLRTMVKAGRDHSLEPDKVAQTIWRALTVKRPKPRYAPAQHPLFEQGLLMVAPRRLIDWAMGRHLGLKPEQGRPGGTRDPAREAAE